MKREAGYDYFEAFRLMCVYYYSLFEGDEIRIDDAMALMKKHGFVDEDGEMIYDEDEDATNV